MGFFCLFVCACVCLFSFGVMCVLRGDAVKFGEECMRCEGGHEGRGRGKGEGGDLLHHLGPRFIYFLISQGVFRGDGPAVSFPVLSQLSRQLSGRKGSVYMWVCQGFPFLYFILVSLIFYVHQLTQHPSLPSTIDTPHINSHGTCVHVHTHKYT